jgi:ubiquinol-cytochrome c reductase cytochrome b subunit
MGATMQINPVWVFGPYNPAEITAGSQPDWYMGFVEGAIRIMPNWEWHIGSTTWSWNVFLPGIGVMTLFFLIMGIYPFAEAWVTGDKSEHHVLDRPRNNPTRTAFGVAAMTAYAMLWIGGGNDLVATQFHVSLNSVTYFLRVAVFVAPVIAFLVTKRICIGLQHADHDRMLHGAESGVIDRAPSGKYSERHRPISAGEAFKLTQHEDLPALLPLAEVDGMSEKEIKSEQRRRRRPGSISSTRCAGRPGRDRRGCATPHASHAPRGRWHGNGGHHAIEAEEEEHHLAR